jgi:hypothetical protein
MYQQNELDSETKYYYWMMTMMMTWTESMSISMDIFGNGLMQSRHVIEVMNKVGSKEEICEWLMMVNMCNGKQLVSTLNSQSEF